MNKATRAAIEKIVNALETIGDEVESLHDDEQEKFDNAPEGLEGSERYAAIEAAADNLDTAHDNITEAIEAADLKAVDPRQHDVQQRHPGIGVLLQLVQCLFAGLRLNDVVPGTAQVDDDKAADAGLILQHHYFLHSAYRPFFSVSCRRRTTPW